MKSLRHFQRNLTMVFSGLQETIIAIADHVNQHIQKIKLNMDAKALEQDIQKAQASLGEQIYRHPDVSLGMLYEKDEINESLTEISNKQKQLEAVESIVSPYETLHDFERLLIRSDYVIQNIVISSTYHGLGKSIETLAPPENMLIFFVKRKNHIELAYGNVVIHPKDEVTFLCAKEDVQTAISFWK